jgi:hypothetical protein
MKNAPQRLLGVAVFATSGWRSGRSAMRVRMAPVPVASEPTPVRAARQALLARPPHHHHRQAASPRAPLRIATQPRLWGEAAGR